MCMRSSITIVAAPMRRLLRESPCSSGVDVFDTPPFLAGDLPESLHRTLAAVGLEATTQGQMLITPMAQCLSAPDPARAGCGESIFPDIDAHHGPHATGSPSADSTARLKNHCPRRNISSASFGWRSPDLALVIPRIIGTACVLQVLSETASLLSV